jgi:hypothetical protein
MRNVYTKDFDEVWGFLASCGVEGREWRKCSVKYTAFLRWKSLTRDDKAAAIKGIPLNIAFVNEERRVKFPNRPFCGFEVYLSQRRWENLIDEEDARFATLESAKAVAEKRAQEKPQQLPLALVVPIDERKAKLAAANLSLINQNKHIIEPVVEECATLAKSRSNIVGQRRWDELRKRMPYLPNNWSEVKFG